jgi:ribonuclease D
MPQDERVLETPDALARAIAILSPITRLTVDTEFLWERTYYPKLALLQVAGVDAKGDVQAFAADPLAIDVMPLLKMLAEPSRLKVMHAGRLDQQIMNMELGSPLRPLFDTQKGAALAGFGGQIGYANLVSSLFNRKLEKKEQYTDWTRRPLRASQIEYALLDVIPLLDVHDALVKKLEASGRIKWAEEEMASLMDPETYAEPRSDELYLKVKNKRGLDRRGLGILRELAMWRDKEARKRDCRPTFVVKDPGLAEIANRRPNSVKILQELRGLHRKEAGRSGKAILACIRRGETLDESELPQVKRGTKKTKNVDAAVDLLKAYLAKRTQEVGVAVETVVTTKELERLARDASRERYKHEHPVLNGWRGELIGKDLVKILRGEITLGVDPASSELRLVDTGEHGRPEEDQ